MNKKIPVITIDTGVPVPTNRWPLDSLEVDESFVFPRESEATVRTVAWRLKKNKGKVFVVRKQDDNTMRVWRTE